MLLGASLVLLAFAAPAKPRHVGLGQLREAVALIMRSESDGAEGAED